jgi:putative IMPACT (imprinted ancient) family translation regulator
MATQSTQFDFGNGFEPEAPFSLYEKIIEDRKSRYSVSIGKVKSRDELQAFLKKLKQDKKYRDATHNSWAARISHEGAVFETKRDDGEAGAGMVILRMMQKHNCTNCIVCVTRWFGGIKLMGDRFKHVQDAAEYAIIKTKENQMK